MKTRKAGALALLTAGVMVGMAACAPATPADGEVQELLIWDTGILGRTLDNGEPDLENSFLDRMAVAFEEANPGVKITTAQQGQDISTNSAQFQAAMIAGTGPDIRVQYAGGPTISFGDFFVDLEPLLSQKTLDSLQGFNVNREGYDPAGRILGMPYGAGNLFTIFQNNALLEEAGLDPADTPETWEELLENGQQVMDNTDAVGFSVANLEGYVGAWFISAIVGGELGETVFTEMFAGEIPVDHPAMVKAYQAFAEWGASGLTNPDAGQLSGGGAPLFIDNGAAYYLVGSWENNLMLESFGEGNVSSFFIPMLEGAPYPKIGAGGPEIAISITNTARNQDLAVQFLEFLADPANQDIFVEIYQTQGSNHPEGDPSKIQNPLLREQFEQLSASTDGVTFAFDSVMPQATIDLFYRVNAAVFLGTLSPADAVAQLKASYEQEIANQ
ncbi:MAG: carbohydrate ABC transporter substrate-binding protein [Microcella sp.]|uniref:ABC transporter substrate-binding protein n=1 Tax=Microcella sp. TaxID=1913979 RepID=UPI0024C9E945|nr:ABC transporter substrate-binding protein [Microcella sp.]UYN82904.1 MAG: carbohydrate ABC transporter substrate-binding protein [Microcella sp.]